MPGRDERPKPGPRRARSDREQKLDKGVDGSENGQIVNFYTCWEMAAEEWWQLKDAGTRETIGTDEGRSSGAG